VSLSLCAAAKTPLLMASDLVSAEDMPKLHKSHLNVLKVDTNPSTLSLHQVAAAAPPIPNRAKKKGKQISGHSLGADSPHPSESGWSDAENGSIRSAPNGMNGSFVASPTVYGSAPDTPVSCGRSWFAPGKRRKPPAVPDRNAKPGSQNRMESHDAESLGRSKSHPAWSPEFEADDPLDRAGQNKEEKKEKHSLGFTALAQALQEAGGRRKSARSRHGEDESSRADEVEQAKEEPNTPTIVVEGADDGPSASRREGRWYQATGWTTFA